MKSGRTIPKYSFEILVVQLVVGIACIVLLFLDEYRSWACLYILLILISVMQLYRLRRARKRLDQETLQILQEIAKHRNREPTLHEPQPTMDDALKGLREEIERHRVAKDEV